MAISFLILFLIDRKSIKVSAKKSTIFEKVDKWGPFKKINIVILYLIMENMAKKSGQASLFFMQVFFSWTRRVFKNLIEHRYCYVTENFLGFDAVQGKKTKQKMAGLAGFEPAHDGIKTRCLTAWRQPIKVFNR